MEERNLKKKLILFLLGIALLVGTLSGCLEEDKKEPAANNAPVISFTYTVDHNTSMAGGTVNFDSTATDADNDDLTYSWDFGDGETSTEADPQHIYSTNGSYTVMVTVNDTTDETTTSDTVIVGNVPPVASFIYTTDNMTVTFTSTSTDSNTDAILTYEWKINGTAVNTSGEFTYEFEDYGTYNVVLTVMDQWGLANSTDAIEITIETTE
jgi:PKD repeat protein